MGNSCVKRKARPKLVREATERSDWSTPPASATVPLSTTRYDSASSLPSASATQVAAVVDVSLESEHIGSLYSESPQTQRISEEEPPVITDVAVILSTPEIRLYEDLRRTWTAAWRMGPGASYAGDKADAYPVDLRSMALPIVPTRRRLRIVPRKRGEKARRPAEAPPRPLLSPLPPCRVVGSLLPTMEIRPPPDVGQPPKATPTLAGRLVPHRQAPHQRYANFPTQLMKARADRQKNHGSAADPPRLHSA